MTAIRKISELKVEEPYKSLFRIDGDILTAIQKNMKERGFDQSQPITVWRGRNIVIDGHTRLQAARNVGFKVIRVFERDFKDENAALKYAINNQRNRRNLNDADILHLVEKVDQLFPQGGDRKSKFVNAKIDRPHDRMRKLSRREEIINKIRERTPQDSREITAKIIGISTDKVSECRHVMKHCSKLRREINKIKDGTKSLYQVYRDSLLAERNEKKKMEQQEINRNIVKELKINDFPSSKHLTKNAENLDNLVLKWLPELYKHEPEMYKIMTTVKDFESQGDRVFKIFCDRVHIQKFLGHLFITDFIAILESFGYKIKKPARLKVIEQKRIPKVDKRKGKMPVFNIGRIHESGYISKSVRKEIDDTMGRHAERDMEQQAAEKT